MRLEEGYVSTPVHIRCCAHGCRDRVFEGAVDSFCGKHWKTLPKEMRQRIFNSHTSGQYFNGSRTWVTQEYRDAKREAIDFLKGVS